MRPPAGALRREIQVVFQDPLSSLSPRQTIEAIVGEGLEIHEPELDAAARRARVIEALLDVGLTEGESVEPLLQRYPHEFSGGQRQRIAIARALIVQPEGRRAGRADERARRDDPEAGPANCSRELQRKYG